MFHFNKTPKNNLDFEETSNELNGLDEQEKPESPDVIEDYSNPASKFLLDAQNDMYKSRIDLINAINATKPMSVGGDATKKYSELAKKCANFIAKFSVVCEIEEALRNNDRPNVPVRVAKKRTTKTAKAATTTNTKANANTNTKVEAIGNYLPAAKVMNVETKETFNSMRTAADIMGCSVSNISLACSKGNTAMGYHWKKI